jgi:hypothetical protein
MASFAYLDPSRALLEALGEALIPQEPDIFIQAVPKELDDSWNQFEKDLGNFKLKLVKTNRDLNSKMARLEELNNNNKVSKMVLEHITDEALKTKLLTIIDNHESQEGISALTQQCGELKGEIEAMKKVLKDTHAERYAKFTCFVCIERFIDLFIDPCGHVVCEHCWFHTRDKRHCPACRGNITAVKKIFTM